MNTKEQLQEVKDRLSQLDPNNRDNLVEISRLKAMQNELQQNIMIEEDALKSAQIQQQAAVIDASAVEVQRQYDFVIDFDDIFGTSILNDEIQKLLDAQREQLHSYYMGLQEDRDNTIREQRKEIDAINDENKSLNVAKSEAELERNDFKKRFENSGTVIKELQDEVSRLKEREMELLEAAEKAPLLYPHRVIDIGPSNLDAGDAIREQRAKELAAKPKVWNLQWVDDLKQTEYKGVGEDGTELIIKRLELGRYNVQVGPRPEQIVTEVATEDAKNSVTPDDTFPKVPDAEAPSIPNQLDQEQPSREVPAAQVGTVTREEFEALRTEVEVLKLRVAS